VDIGIRKKSAKRVIGERYGSMCVPKTKQSKQACTVDNTEMNIFIDLFVNILLHRNRSG
jgi:hypothetical protein